MRVQTRISDGRIVSEVFHEPICKWVADRATPPKAGTEYRLYDPEQVKHLRPHSCS